ncbi:MAG: UDP-N-acetylmuramate--L-alanine ligase [Simkaniaceae bacterium]|nr:UDP-N-acetylmuramate--L-alanine ligase [Simkaniaceae bacterium]
MAEENQRIQEESGSDKTCATATSTHFVGIGGIGMSSLATILLEKGENVTGSDIKEGAVVEKLTGKGAKIGIGHDAAHADGAERIIYSTAIDKSNPETALELPKLHRSDLLKDLIDEKKGLLVAGTHGKTGTSGLLAWTLDVAGEDPSFAIGGFIGELDANGRHGEGDFFVAEACESDGTFLKYSGHAAIVTNADFDHIDFWKSRDENEKGFESFLDKPFEHLFVCGDDALLKKSGKGTTYGLSDDNDIVVSNFRQDGWYSLFDLTWGEKSFEDIKLNLPGKHNALNAAAVFALCHALGIAQEAIYEAFETFPGMKRRVQKIGEKEGVLFIDDYAHHPLEVSETLLGLKRAFPFRRLVAIFQPHRFTRLKAFLDEFSSSFDAADEVLITDVFAAGEKPDEKINSELLAANTPHATYVPWDDLVETAQTRLLDGDIAITLGAGSITTICPKIIESMET